MNRWRDWYDQGIRDLKKAELDYQHQFYEWACFTCQQASEKVIKSLGLSLGIELWGNSLTEMLIILSKKIPVEGEMMNYVKLLDLYYIPTRYPNGFAEGNPAKYFTEKQAREAIDATYSIVKFCESFLLR